MPAATTESELLEALRRDPSAEAMHVYADFLQECGDSRGELLVLQHREATAGIDDAPTLERLLVLIAQHGVLRVPDDPEACSLPFRGGARTNERQGLEVRYRVVHDGRVYRVIDPMSYRALLRIEVDGEVVQELAAQELKPKPKQVLWQTFLPEVANVVLSEISTAIRAGTWDHLALPTGPRVGKHPCYRVGRFPTEPVPDELVERWPAIRDCEIELRDLSRWRELYARLALLR